MLDEAAAFNTSALTGESIPRTIRKGGEVLAGMISTDKVIRVEVTRPFEKSALSRILELVQNASERKAPAELFIRKFARVYTPIVTGLAALIVLLPFLYSLANAQFSFIFNDWMYRALVFLVISCPCALVVSIPLGYFGGIGAASRLGILFKGGNYLDAIARINTVVFDKTGTLTKGTFEEQSCHTPQGISEEKLLLSDTLKDDACTAIEELKALNINNIQILSGDKQAIVTNFAEKLGVARAYGDLLPDGKVEHIEELKRNTANRIVFVGDGINDAPVLAFSHVGIAMGGLGSDAAIETADVVIQTDQPSKVATAICAGKQTRRIVWQNISLAFGVKLLVLALGAGGLATLWEAVFADVGVALIAIVNAIRVQKLIK